MHLKSHHAAQDIAVFLMQVSREEAEARIKELGEPYKLEILEDIARRDPNASITIYHIGEKGHPDHWCLLIPRSGH